MRHRRFTLAEIGPPHFRVCGVSYIIHAGTSEQRSSHSLANKGTFENTHHHREIHEHKGRRVRIYLMHPSRCSHNTYVRDHTQEPSSFII